ncbi:MAG TPA: cytochrome c3 family protein [Terriglobales bacterium]|nr:cytochrome c3 family protein [Terriglobales bacterium]
MRWLIHAGVLISLVVVGVTLTAAQQLNVWSNGGVHPVPLKANAGPKECKECHTDIGKGKYVHTAMAMGCTTCHEIQNKGGNTEVRLVSPVTQLCLTCHPLSSDKVLHGPYKAGDCVICHSPHASNFPGHTWVSTQDTCLGCHAQSRLQVHAKQETATVPWGVTLTLEQMKGCQYLELNQTLTAGHPVAGHPVSGPNTVLGMEAPPITCLSCHKPHASQFASLLVKTPPDRAMPLCKSCSLCVDCHHNM